MRRCVAWNIANIPPHSTPNSLNLYVQLSRNSELSAFEFLWRVHYTNKIESLGSGDQLTHQTHPEATQKLPALSQLLTHYHFWDSKGFMIYTSESTMYFTVSQHGIVYHSFSVSWPVSLSQRQGWRWEGHSRVEGTVNPKPGIRVFSQHFLPRVVVWARGRGY